MSNGIAYTLNQTAKARRLSIKVDSHGQVIVSAPRFVPKFAIARFVESARPWIEKQQLEQRQKPVLLSPTAVYYFGKKYPVKVSQRRDLTVKVGLDALIVASAQLTEESVLSLIESWLKARAIEYVSARVYAIGELMQLSFRGLAFKQQKTRWGSCSSQKNLNFNWKLIHAPKEVIDYVIIHELAHTKEMNHGKRFWDLVSRYDPDHSLHRRWLSRFGSTED